MVSVNIALLLSVKVMEKAGMVLDAEKIKKALSSNVRETTIDNIAIGDDVYYKRNASDGWHGPAKVILIEKKIATLVTFSSAIV